MSEFKQVVKEGFKKVGSWARRFFLALFLVVLAVGGAYVWVAGWTYSDGTRAGNLIKVTKKGVVFKTYEGQLNLGGFQQSTDGVSGNIWEFSVRDPEVYNKLQQYEGQQVKLHYKQRYDNLPWQGKTTYFVHKVQPVRESPEN